MNYWLMEKYMNLKLEFIGYYSNILSRILPVPPLVFRSIKKINDEILLFVFLIFLNILKSNYSIIQKIKIKIRNKDKK